MIEPKRPSFHHWEMHLTTNPYRFLKTVNFILIKLFAFPESGPEPEQDGGGGEQAWHPDQAEAELELPPGNQRGRGEYDELDQKTDLLLQLHGKSTESDK